MLKITSPPKALLLTLILTVILLTLLPVQSSAQSSYLTSTFVGYDQSSQPVFVVVYKDSNDQKKSQLVSIREKKNKVDIIFDDLEGKPYPIVLGGNHYVSLMEESEIPALFTLEGDTVPLKVEGIDNMKQAFSLLIMQFGFDLYDFSPDGSSLFLTYADDRSIGSYDIAQKKITDLGVQGLLPQQAGENLYFFKIMPDGILRLYKKSMEAGTEAQETDFYLEKASRLNYTADPKGEWLYGFYNYRYYFRYNFETGQAEKINPQEVAFTSLYYSLRDDEFKVLKEAEGELITTVAEDEFVFEKMPFEKATGFNKKLFRDFKGKEAFDLQGLKDMKASYSQNSYEKVMTLVEPLTGLETANGFYVEKTYEDEKFIDIVVTDGQNQLMSISTKKAEDRVAADVSLPQGMRYGQLKEEWTQSSIIGDVQSGFAGASFQIVLEGDTYKEEGAPNLGEVITHIMNQEWKYKRR